MDCLDKSTVDLCSEPECLTSSIIPGLTLVDLAVPHTPSHSMLKVHRLLFDRSIAVQEARSRIILHVARAVISDRVKAQGKVMPPCAHCIPCALTRSEITARATLHGL